MPSTQAVAATGVVVTVTGAMTRPTGQDIPTESETWLSTVARLVAAGAADTQVAVVEATGLARSTVAAYVDQLNPWRTSSRAPVRALTFSRSRFMDDREPWVIRRMV